MHGNHNVDSTTPLPTLYKALAEDLKLWSTLPSESAQWRKLTSKALRAAFNQKLDGLESALAVPVERSDAITNLAGAAKLESTLRGDEQLAHQFHMLARTSLLIADSIHELLLLAEQGGNVLELANEGSTLKWQRCGKW